jgi:hypothetical protein
MEASFRPVEQIIRNNISCYHSAWRQNRRPYLGMDSITRWWRPLRVGQDRRRLGRRQPIATAAPSAPFELPFEPQEQVSVNDPTAFFTLWVALFTGVLGVSTILLWRATNRSVKISERALHDLERACIVPAFPKPVERDAEEWYVHISLSNVGRSFGIVKGLFVRFAEPGALPAMPPSEGYEERPTDTVLRIGVENWNGLAPFKMPSKREGQIIYGYIRYEDVFGRIWRNRFACEVWSEEKPGRHYYPTVGGPAYNAETQET